MVSYLDVLTILLIFFVAVAAKSLELAPRLAAASGNSRAEAPSAKEPLREAQRKLVQLGLDARIEPRGLVITLPQAVFFAPGEDHINSAALPRISQIAGVLLSIPNKISLAGHADQVPIHNQRFRNNWELAAARSMQLLDLFTAHYGIAESRFSIVSYGSVDPKSPNETPDGRAMNRRVEIVVLEEVPAT